MAGDGEIGASKVTRCLSKTKDSTKRAWLWQPWDWICTFTTPFVILCYGLSKVDRSKFKKKKITWAICGEQLKKSKRKKSIHEDGTKRGELSGVRTIHSAGSNLCGRTTGDKGAATWFKTPHCSSGSLEADGQSSSEGREAALIKMWVSTAFLWQGMSSGPLQ